VENEANEALQNADEASELIGLTDEWLSFWHSVNQFRIPVMTLEILYGA